MLKKIEIKNLSFKMILTKTNEYTKHELKVLSNLNKFIIDNNSINDIEKVYSSDEYNNIIFIKYKNDNVLKSYYLEGLKLL